MSENTHTGPDEVPNPDSGVGIGAGEPSTFEPEEDVESVPDEPRD